MANLPGEFDRKGWEEWVATRPSTIQELCRRLPPQKLYRLKSTNQRVIVHSYSEDGTVTVDATGEFNQVLFGRRVFGIDPSDLEECDLPGPDEPVGDLCEKAGLTQDEVVEMLTTIRKARERADEKEND